MKRFGTILAVAVMAALSACSSGAPPQTVRVQFLVLGGPEITGTNVAKHIEDRAKAMAAGTRVQFVTKSGVVYETANRNGLATLTLPPNYAGDVVVSSGTGPCALHAHLSVPTNKTLVLTFPCGVG